MLGLGNAAMSDQLAGIELNLDLVFGLSHLHAAPNPLQRDRVPVGVECDITFHVHHALVQAVDLGNPRRQRFQLWPFHGEQLTGDGTDMFLISGVDFIAPLPCLLIQVSPIGECSTCQEVCLYEPEGPFYARGSVGIPNRVRYELKAETLCK